MNIHQNATNKDSKIIQEPIQTNQNSKTNNEDEGGSSKNGKRST
ncbi:36043_t:CDS:2 [Gigaspora margarita]|uniref:36043_t:CDS:1 n=1 Tax=Gigaspora margarita TaxID=4874 RepID=A0ABN7USR6_GIGMA|nr:36043_t:CDS:2 [Gigaspora margarita]